MRRRPSLATAAGRIRSDGRRETRRRRNRHRRARSCAARAAVLLGVSLAPLLLPAAAVAQSTVRYVALGDSYSSGVGAGDYLARSGRCERSRLAYPALWTAAHPPTAYRSVACAGATTDDIIESQAAALTRRTTLVSVSVGGNDVGFAHVMTDCVVYGTDRCVSEVDVAENDARRRLPGLLDAAYRAIRKSAPNARVVVLGYPRFYHDVWWCLGLSSTDREAINAGADVLDTVIAAAAARHGFVFADVRPRFDAGHEICDGSASWLHSVDWTDLAQSYHPKASGQRDGYLPAFAAAARG